MENDEKTSDRALAYLDQQFLGSPDARVIRIISEYLEPSARLRRHGIHDTIVFFGSARSVSPEQAASEMERVSSTDPTDPNPEIRSARIRAEYRLRLSRYYHDAVELARRITEWSKSLPGDRHFIVCSGGGGGMMEAANRGASTANGKTLGLNIHLPHEQSVNRFVTHGLSFNFHYFFMRKFWFVYLAKALVAFPGGFGTVDELFEVLTLIQTKMPRKKMPVVLFGTEFWDEIINFQAMVNWGVVSPEDLNIFFKTDSVDDAFEYLKTTLGELYLLPTGLEDLKLT
ncbi:MAG TPA: LOG family protein [Blastocatellia bacterium]|nr:LOG family protein [Blastocatellia bacterium]